MNMKFLATTAAAAVLLAAPAMAATFTLDDFNEQQLAVADPANTVTNMGGDYAAASRDFTVDATVAENSGSNLASSTRLESFGGLLSFSTTSSVRGSATLTYNGVNLQNSRDKGFFTFNVVPGTFDGDAMFSVAGTDAGGNTISYSENLLSGFSPILRFNEFTFGGSNPFDFTNVASLSFMIDTSNTRGNVDGQLDSITVSAVPVPASGLLLLGAFGGAAALRRRKAKKAA
ncbi:VPLPA-CTERM protein sorting domain-containing protein [Loktanella atrilutea]|uniref:VPLPA-CTERM protein sorting domain-containing protein n=1 Tax=Loktanella atrilutea TaxID=366533 RepID=A0A1M5EVT4_LOKAT|nr:VPLPA-CTERM sorting domain-containing protein [Loktanella atrilutea]SHF83152.1 VPLPA-CTERM protein sorting domain-containing protein [Loktanella atrilutea]